MVAPCKGCLERILGCHDSCTKYQSFHKERAEAREWNREMDNSIPKKTKRKRYKNAYDIRSREDV